MVKRNNYNYSVWNINMHRDRRRVHECNAEIFRKSHGTTHEYTTEIPTKSRGFTHEYKREMPRKSRGLTYEYNRGMPRRNNGTFFKQAKLDGYNRERPRKINGTVVKKVELDGRVITVTVTCESKIVDAWVQKNGGLLLGMDLEWRPNFRGGEENKAALLQLCGNWSSCLVVQLLYLDSVPRSLVGILNDFEVKIAGVGIDKDAEKLYKDHGVKCRGLVDLQYLAAVNLKRTDCLFWGLKRLANEVLGVSIEKDKRAALSDWSKRELQPWQIEYACIDAFVSFCIAAKLMLWGWPRELNLEEFTQACFK